MWPFIPCLTNYLKCGASFTHFSKCDAFFSSVAQFSNCGALFRRRCRRRAYAPTSNTASHDNHKKILHGFPFLSRDDYGAPLGDRSGRRSSAIRHLKVKNKFFQRPRKSLRRNFHIFRLTGTIFHSLPLIVTIETKIREI